MLAADNPLQRAIDLQSGATPKGKGRMMRLPNGQMWNTNDPLPPEETASQPMVNDMNDGYIINRPRAGGMFGNSVPTPAPDLMQMPTNPVEAPKREKWRDIVGSLADFVSVASGGKMSYWPQQQATQQAKREWQNEIEKAKTLEQIRASYKQPTYNTAQEYLIASGVQPGSPDWIAANRQLATKAQESSAPRLQFDQLGRARHPVYGSVIMPPDQMALDYLRQNLDSKAQFDAKYGYGAADLFLGGM